MSYQTALTIANVVRDIDLKNICSHLYRESLYGARNK